MSRAAANTDGAALFACTKCNSRYPFEELSSGYQLCKDCKGSHQSVKCNYCRSEFHLDQKDTKSTSKSSICSKCERLKAQHGKPAPCAYCNIIAAFIGTKCQRCTNSEKKYGAPMSCEHCRQKCAFDRKDPESKKKVDGKLLCWLCTMAYKRVLAKARHKESLTKSGALDQDAGHHQSRRYKSNGSRNHTSSNGQSHRKISTASNPSAALKSHTTTSTSHRDHHRPHTHRYSPQLTSSASNSKKPRLDSAGTTNGNSASSLPSINSLTDSNGNDLSTMMTQLKDQVAQLHKRLQLKDKELLSKDRQIADLKSTSTREQRELREKISGMQKEHTEKMSALQAKLVTMQKQIASHNKAPRTPAANNIEAPLVI